MGKKPSKAASKKKHSTAQKSTLLSMMPRLAKPAAVRSRAVKPASKKPSASKTRKITEKSASPTRVKKDIEVLLAKIWNDAIDPTGRLMSEKLDGVRAYWIAKMKKLFTRDGNEIKAPAWFTAGFPTFDVDGELWGGRGKFQGSVGIVKRLKEDEGWKKIKYMVFDAPEINGPFTDRNQHLIDWFKTNKSPWISLVNQTYCKSRAHLDKTLDAICEIGGEGVMLRDPRSKYERKRSSSLLKVKKVLDTEARIIGYTKGTGKYVGMVGALRMELPNGNEFKIGAGLTDADRAHPPAVGSIVTFDFQGYSDEGIPRNPRNFRVRKDVTWKQLVARAKKGE